MCIYLIPNLMQSILAKQLTEQWFQNNSVITLDQRILDFKN